MLLKELIDAVNVIQKLIEDNHNKMKAELLIKTKDEQEKQKSGEKGAA